MNKRLSQRQQDVLRNLFKEGPLALLAGDRISATQAVLVERGFCALSRDRVLSITDLGRAQVED